MQNILIVEDNVALNRLVSIKLRKAGYNPISVSSSEEALKTIDSTMIHLFIIDVMLPGEDGISFTRLLREAGYDQPVLIITAKGSLEDKKIGFSAGADDYMTKPFDPEEVILRVDALLKRYGLSNNRVLTYGKTTLNAETLQVISGDTVIELRNREFGLLATLLSSPLKIFTRQMLMDEIWGFETESDPRTIDTHIKRLREKLADIDDFTIITVRGLGYKAVINSK